MPRRHGLRTVALGERDGDRQALTRQVLARGSAVLTRTPEAGDGQQMENGERTAAAPGETGRTTAVVEVDAAHLSTVAELSKAHVTSVVTFDLAEPDDRNALRRRAGHHRLSEDVLVEQRRRRTGWAHRSSSPSAASVGASMSAIAPGFADQPRRRWRARDDLGVALIVVGTGVIWSDHSRL